MYSHGPKNYLFGCFRSQNIAFVVIYLCSPNEDFGRMNKRWNPDFRPTFQWFVAQIEYSLPWKVLRKSGFHLLFILPKSSFGRVKIACVPDVLINPSEERFLKSHRVFARSFWKCLADSRPSWTDYHSRACPTHQMINIITHTSTIRY
jgi:hypothetical protein